MNKRLQSGFLFAQPSFASGAARTLDIWGQFDEYTVSASSAEADARAIASDWLVIGQDIFDAIGQQESEFETA